MATHSAGKTINISMAKELLKRLDEAAKVEYSSRSEFIRAAVVERLGRVEYAEQHGWTPSTAGNSVNLLMTDKQLDDTMEALQQERDRRFWKKDRAERVARHNQSLQGR
jgi:metal-responsive CopG/Arc/MetJ family transcriptional regulator